MDIKQRLSREAKAANIDVFYSKLGNRGVEVAKAQEKQIYLVHLAEADMKKSWVLTQDGLVEYDNDQEAVTAFVNLQKTASFPYARKSSVKKAAAHCVKTANRIKTASELGDGDPWIRDPNMLISKASQELWALTNDGKYLARLFDENQFPLKV